MPSFSAMISKSFSARFSLLYSLMAAALLCALLWFYFPYRKYNGQVFALMLILYSITRFLLESIRTDESGIWNTPLTISQWISVIAAIVGILMFLLIRSPIETATRQQPPDVGR